MSSGSEQMQVEFHNRATDRLFAMYQTFKNATSNLNRRTEEFRFQQLKKLYAATMEQELQVIAKDILERHRDEKQIKGVDLMFHQLIKDYLHRFIQKVKDL